MKNASVHFTGGKAPPAGSGGGGGEQRFGWFILSEHFLHHQFCFAEDDRAVDSKQAGNVFINVGQENKFPLA